MRRSIFISLTFVIIVLLCFTIPSYAQKTPAKPSQLSTPSQDSYTILLLDFEDQSGLQNPLLSKFIDTIAFVLSKQTASVQVRLIPKAERDAFLNRAKYLKPNATPLDQALLAADSADADALVVGSYTKQGNLWSLQAQVYHRKAGQKTKQEIQIQGDSVYKLLDDFPKQLLQQFTGTTSITLTTTSWKAYEEFRKGLEEFENYNFLGALEHYNNVLKLDPTLALAYSEQSRVYFMMGQVDQATKAIKAAQKLLPKASPIEQLAIRALDYSWDAEKNTYRYQKFGIINLTSGGVLDEALVHMILATAYEEEGKHVKANQHNQQWFKAIQSRIRANPEDASLLHQTASYCLEIGQYVDEAIKMELKAVELNLGEENWEVWYVLSRLYESQGDIEQSLKWARQAVQHLPDPRVEASVRTGDYSSLMSHLASALRKGKISPEWLLGWCEDMLRIPGLLQPHRVQTRYLIAQIYDVMNDKAKMEAMLASLGAPLERDWMVIGPFDASVEDPFPQTPPFELLTNLAEPRRGILGKEVQWEPWEDSQPLDGRLSINQVFKEKYYGTYESIIFTDPFSRTGESLNFSPSSVVFSCIYVEVPTAVEAQVRTGSGMMRIWLNDNPSPVVKVDMSWRVIQDHKANSVLLKAGLNRFLIATVSGSFAFEFSFRITDSEGKPIPGLKFVSAKEIAK